MAPKGVVNRREIGEIANLIQTVTGILHNVDDPEHQIYLAHSAIRNLNRFIDRKEGK